MTSFKVPMITRNVSDRFEFTPDTMKLFIGLKMCVTSFSVKGFVYDGLLMTSVILVISPPPFPNNENTRTRVNQNTTKLTQDNEKTTQLRKRTRKQAAR